MTNCLLCKNDFAISFSANDLFSFQSMAHPVVCPRCEQSFHIISPTQHCNYCGRFLEAGDCCHDCERWKKHYPQLLKNTAIYHYDDFFKRWIEQYKFKYDCLLAQVMRPMLIQQLHRFPNHIVVPIPSALDRRAIRGFDPAAHLLDTAGVTYQQVLKYIGTGRKQSEKTRQERMMTGQCFSLDEQLTSQLVGRDVLLFDDVYTTGRTLYHAYDLIETRNPRSVNALTLAR